MEKALIEALKKIKNQYEDDGVKVNIEINLLKSFTFHDYLLIEYYNTGSDQLWSIGESATIADKNGNLIDCALCIKYSNKLSFANYATNGNSRIISIKSIYNWLFKLTRLDKAK